MLEQCEYITEKIDGIGPWLWPIGDWEGFRWPKEDWINEHKHNWLNTVKGYKTVIQAGGLCGMYPRLLSDHFETVITFEPNPLSFFCLVNNCQKSNIIKIQAALGKEHCMVGNEVEFDHNRGMSHIISGNQIPMITIDSINVSSCDLIQLDIEGFEADALIGAELTIERFRPTICVERFWQNRTDPGQVLRERFDYIELKKSAVLDYIYVPKEFY